MGLFSNLGGRRGDRASQPPATLVKAMEGLKLRSGTFQRDSELSRLIVQHADELLAQPEELTVRERLSLITGDSTLTAELALTLQMGDLTLDFFERHNIKVGNLMYASLGPALLARLGVVAGPKDLIRLGFDAGELSTYPEIALEAVRAFGTAACRDAWLVSASDAVWMAGEETAGHFEIEIEHLLERCVALPVAAQAVLAQLQSPGFGVRALDPALLVRAGLTAELLRDAGVSLNDVLHAKASPRQLLALGYVGF